MHLTRMVHRLPKLTLFTKGYCPLCDEALADLECLQSRFQLEKIFIDQKGNEMYFHKYKWDIPVFHFENDFLMKHRADVQLLESKLNHFESSSLLFMA